MFLLDICVHVCVFMCIDVYVHVYRRVCLCLSEYRWNIGVDNASVGIINPVLVLNKRLTARLARVLLLLNRVT